MSNTHVSATICPVDSRFGRLVRRYAALQFHNMRLVTIKREAERLISEHGLVAHDRALEGHVQRADAGTYD
jgi:hypothetical protein